MLIDVNSYVSSLKKLWAETFGDNEEYIGLLFDRGYSPAECFAEISDNEVVSVIYLLEGRIRADGRVFEGRYLYAAATAEKHRKKGLMAKLIKEAQKYISEKGLSFISLVPANEVLYDYYAKFGFESVMYNYRAIYNDMPLREKGEAMTPHDYFYLRRKLTLSDFSFTDKALQYATLCLSCADFDFVSNTEDSCYIVSADGSEVLEYISSEENYIKNTEVFLSRLAERTEIVSPYDLSDFCQCTKSKFGMVYFSDNAMKNTVKDAIYMNIALD